MSTPLAEVRIGQPVSHGSLTVFPLFGDESRPIEYLLSDEAMEAGTVTVSEVSEQGSVPDLSVENKSAKRVLLLEGEELRGAKQNRILNTSVLVPATSKLRIPVSCVEQGRWRRTSAVFSSSKMVSPYRLRRTIKSSVSRSLHREEGHRSDQGQVWEDVQAYQAELDVSSSTSALSDTFDKFQEHLTVARKALQYVPGASGLAVAIGSRVVSADLFDKAATCQKVWDRLLSGVMLDALSVKGKAGDSPDPDQVAQLLQQARNADWTQTEVVGEGQEYRAEFDGKVASALLLDGSLVHGSVLAPLS